MALTRPVLLTVSAFDATTAYTFRFNSIGGDQVVKNRLVINDNATNTTVYDQQQTTFRYEHTVPAGTLTNGTYYNATVYTYNNAGDMSVASNVIQFYCYSTPTIQFTNVQEGGTVGNAAYAFEFTYSQAQNEALNYYTVNLYDTAGLLISTSGEQYANSTTVPLDLSYTFTGFDDGAEYGIEVVGSTINSTIVRTGIVNFSVIYTQPNVFTLIELRNNCAGGYINITSNIAIIDGEVSPAPPIFIDNKELDLRGDDAYVVWDEGYEILGGFTGIIIGRDFNPYSKIFQMSDTNGNIIEILWMLGYEHPEQDISTQTLCAYARLNVKPLGANVFYTIKSELIPNPADTSYVKIWLRRINDLYEIHINQEEGGSTS